MEQELGLTFLVERFGRFFVQSQGRIHFAESENACTSVRPPLSR